MASEAINCESYPEQSISPAEKELCHTMEKRCNEKLNEQRIKYDQLLSELTSDLEIITSHLSSQNMPSPNEDDNKHLENSIHELEEQNDRLQKSIISYEGQLKDSQNQIKSITMDGHTLRRKLADMEYQLRSKETLVEELRNEESSLREELHIQKQICKCHSEASLENQDALSLRLQEMHHQLSAKSAETQRNATALRWKNIELERLDKLTGEEKQRLNNEIGDLMKMLADTKNRVQELERSIESKSLEVSKLNQRLEDSAQKEWSLQDNLMRNMSQLTNLENELFKWVLYE